MIINRIVIIVLALFSNAFFGQSAFDKFENQEDINSILVNKKKRSNILI